MADRRRKFSGSTRGTLRPDRKEKRQAEALERQNRYDHEVDSGQVAKPDSIHWKSSAPSLSERLNRFQIK